MIENQGKPAIRFKDFTDAWEQRKVGDLYEPVTEKNDLTYGIERNITVATMQFKTDIRVTNESYLRTYNVFLLGDIAFEGHQTKEFRFGRFVENDIGAGIVSHIFSVFRPKMEYDLLFWKYAINNEIVMRPILSRCTKASRMMNDLVTTDFLREQLLVPPIDEQRKIGQLFDGLDALITLHQREYDKTVNFKKAMLEKMFPKNGEDRPEIRFKGFTDAWEQRKAKELCSIGTGKSNTQDQVDGGKYQFFIRSDVPVKSDKYLYDCEAVITIGDGNIGKVFHYVNGKFDLHQRCYKMTDFQGILGKYFYYYFSTKFYARAIKMTAKATVDSVRLEMISEMDIQSPPQATEQKQIAGFFTNLDHLITLHQRELKKLQNMKKAMLEKMFV